MTQTDYKNILIPCPTIEEQRRIVEYLDKRCNQINRHIKKIESIIELLNELKTRIIADTVTGRIDVRDVVIPDYEFIYEEADPNDEDDPESTKEQED